MPQQSVDDRPQYVLVFDDISDLLSAQRAKTWSDLARRLAHEIKNPLTPIQLSAERLLKRLSDRIAPEDREILGKSCQTIVEQVAGLKAMVDEFRDYARLPEAKLTALQLGQLVQDVLPLYASDPRVKCAEVDEAPVVMADQAQMRQVIHNLIQNAQDALGDGVAGEILLSVGRDRASANAYLRVDDSGPGIAPEMQAKLFEPYSTNKPKGSGLGLAIVRKIAEENHATITVQNRVDTQGRVLGARAELQFAEVPNQAENSRHG
jgi:nitrogen fixation/metabolism regulation signal transduction histidine kinase